MNKTVLVAAAGLLALAGAAMADQAVVVKGKLNTPAGEVPVDLSTGALPLPADTGLPVGQSAEDLNAALGDDSPARVESQDNGLRPNLRCSALGDLDQGGALEPACQNEPTVEWVDNEYVAIGPNGASVKQWIQASSGQVFSKIPDEIWSEMPEEQRAAIEDAHEQVNFEAAAAMLDDAQRNANSNRPRFYGGTDDLLQGGKLSSLLAGLGFKGGSVGEGLEAQWQPEGWDELFANDAPGLQADQRLGSHGIGGGPDGSQGGSGGALAAMAVMAALVGAPLVGGAALYHRIRSNHTLNNKTRQAVYDAVVRNPGIGVNDAARAAGCSYSTAAYHLERLVEERLLVASEDGRRARFFKNGGAFSQGEREFIPVLQSDECMAVMQVIVENPWCYRAEVAQKLGVSGPTVNWHLKRLMKVGVVKEMREGRVSYLYADKKLLAQLGANLIGKVPEELVAKLRSGARPPTEFVEPGLALPETSVPEVGLGEYDDLELAPLPEASS